MTDRETWRQLVHLGVVLFALPVPFLGPKWALALTLGAVIHNWVFMPLTGLDRGFKRDGERFVSGVRIYPVAVLLLVLLFPLTVAMGAWAHLAIGDGFSNILGRRFGRTKLPWNPRKSWAGTVGFVLTAAPAGALLMAYTEHFGGSASFLSFWPEHMGIGAFTLPALALLSLAGALVGALLESLPIRIDDNLSVSLGSGTVMAALAIALSS